MLWSLLCFLKLDLDQAIHWTILAALLSVPLKLETIAKAFSVGMLISGLLAVVQVLGWSPVHQIAPPAGLFLNKNIMGETACLTLILCLQLRLPFWSLASLPALMLSSSRAAWLAALAALLLMRPKLSALILVLAILTVSIGLMPQAVSTGSLMQRLEMWHQALEQVTWLGNGTYSRLMPYGREVHLHNEWIQLVYELGVFGLVPLALVLAVPSPFTVALAIIACFGFPFHMPATAALAAVVLGHYLRHAVDDFGITLRARVA